MMNYHARASAALGPSTVLAILIGTAATPRPASSAVAAAAARADGGTGTLVMAEMQVTAARSPGTVADVPASVSVISSDAISANGYTTLDQAMAGVAGTDVQGGGLPVQEVKVGMRGLTPGYQSKRVLVIVDGRRINDAFQGNPEFSLLPLGMVEQIEVVKGPASALYGSGAMGGVVQVFTRETAGEPFANVSIAGGTYNTLISSLACGAPIGEADILLSFGHTETGGYMENLDGSDRSWRFDHADTSVAIPLGAHAALRVQAGVFGAHGADNNSVRDAWRDYQSLSFRHDGASDDSHTQAIIYRNGSEDIYDWVYPGKGVYRQETLAAEVSHSRMIGPSHRVVAGVETRQEAVDVEDVSSTIDESAATAALYVQDEMKLRGGFALTGGVRQDLGEGENSALSPRAGLLWKANESLDLYASVAGAHRAPPLSDRYVNVTYNGFLFEGNPDLDPEQLLASEAGCRLRVNNRLRLSAAVFENRLWDTFDFMLDPDMVFRNRNVNRARTWGAELDARLRITPGLEAYAAASYTDGEYEKYDADPDVEGNRLAYLAPGKAVFGLQWTGRWGAHGFRARYVGERYGDAQNTEANAMDEYWVFDWRSTVPVSGNLDLTFRADNIFDESYGDFPGTEQPGTVLIAGVNASF